MFYRFTQTGTREKYRLNEGIPECIATNSKVNFQSSDYISLSAEGY